MTGLTTGGPLLRRWHLLALTSVVLGVLLVAGAATAADDPAAAPLATPIPLADASAIDAALPAMRTTTRMLERMSAEGAQGVAYSSKRHGLEKIEVVALGEHGRDRLDFYWRSASLLAARSRHLDYGALITEIPLDQPLTLTLIDEDVVEYQGGRVVRWIHNNTVQDVDTSAATAIGRQLAEQAASMRRQMTTPSTNSKAKSSRETR